MPTLYKQLIWFVLLLCQPISLWATTPLINIEENKIKFPNVTLLARGRADDEFWEPLVTIMKTAATDLGVKLEVHYTDRNPVLLMDKGIEIINRKEKPDYFVLVNDRDSVPKLMKLADSNHIKTVLMNGPLSEEKYKEFKHGNNALKYWIGGVLPDEEQSGYLLAKTLIEKARQIQLYSDNTEKTIKVVGINGALRSFVTVLRERGLRKYVNEQRDVQLERVVNAYWEKKHAEGSVNLLLKTYPETTVIWSASDLMAMGAIDGAKLNNRHAGKDFLTCGIDWIKEVLEPLKKGEISCTVGGHIFDGAWLMVLLLDHFNGLTPRFIDYKTQFSTIDKTNLQQLYTLMNPDLWKTINFKRFSKSYGNKHPDTFGTHLLLNKF